VTVMFDRYFGIPQHVLRSGLWSQMKPSEQGLYVCLMHESERCSTREIQRTDDGLCKLSGLSSRAFCNARKKLQERGLVVCRRGKGNVYVYTICNPETRSPWPGHPKQRIVYRRKECAAPANECTPTTANDVLVTLTSASPFTQERDVSFSEMTPKARQIPPATRGNPALLQSHGVPLKF
jgi:hypothetical protein